jgi:hypothetical protein
MVSITSQASAIACISHEAIIDFIDCSCDGIEDCSFIAKEEYMFISQYNWVVLYKYINNFYYIKYTIVNLDKFFKYFYAIELFPTDIIPSKVTICCSFLVDRFFEI